MNEVRRKEVRSLAKLDRELAACLEDFRECPEIFAALMRLTTLPPREFVRLLSEAPDDVATMIQQLARLQIMCCVHGRRRPTGRRPGPG